MPLYEAVLEKRQYGCVFLEAEDRDDALEMARMISDGYGNRIAVAQSDWETDDVEVVSVYAVDYEQRSRDIEATISQEDEDWLNELLGLEALGEGLLDPDLDPLTPEPEPAEDLEPVA